MRHADFDETADTTIDLGRLRAGIGAARGRIALAALIAAGLAGGVANLWPRPSIVEARALIETAAPSPSATAGDRLRRDDEIVAAQIALLGSDGLMRRVAAAEPDAVATVLGEAGEGRTTERDGSIADERRTTALRDGLAVERIDRTRLVTLRLAAADAEAAGRVLTAVERQWIAGAEEARARARTELLRRHAAPVEAARRRLAEAEAAAAEPDPAESEATAARAALQTERAEAEVRLRRLQAFAAAGGNGAERAVDAAPTETLRDLRDQRGALRTRLARLSAVYLGNHPLMKDIQADFAELHRRMRAELPRAVATAETELATLDRRIAEAAAETTASVPTPAPAALDDLRTALAAAEAHRDAAVAEGLAAGAVEIRPLGTPEIVRTAGPLRPLLAAGLGALLAAALALAWIAKRTAVAARRVAFDRDGTVVPDFDERSDLAFTAVPPVAASLPPLPVEATLVAPSTVGPDEEDPMTSPADAAAPVEAAAPAPAVPSFDPEAAARAEHYRAAAAPIVPGLWRALAGEVGPRCRLVVISTRDAAWARGAGEAIAAAVTRPHERVGRVDLCRGAAGDAAPGVTDLLDGMALFSEVMRRDPASGLSVVSPGARDVTDADLVDPGFTGLLEALEVTWDVLIVDAGRLEGRDGIAALLTTADAVVLAEDDAEDARATRIADILTDAGCPTWILDAPVASARGEAETDVAPAADWARAA